MDKLNILRCEDEPIQIPGLIQPIGYFFAVDKDEYKIKYIGENIGEIYTHGAKDLLDTQISDLFVDMKSIIEDFKTKCQQCRERYFDVDAKFCTQRFDLFMSCYDERYILCEFIPRVSSEYSLNNVYDKVIHNITEEAKDINKLFQSVVRNIRDLTKYDRVMLYKFDSDYNGEVIAESKIDSIDSYLNLHYPSSDIPAQARKLYLKNTTRIIGNVNYQAQGVISYYDEPIDMSFGFLRSVSPIHLEYMKNMGVYASMTLSIIINDKLWGLIACHHGSEFIPSFETIEVCEKISKIVSYLIKIFEEKEYESNKNKFLGTIDTISSVMKQNIGIKDSYLFMIDNVDMFKSLFEADGVICLYENDISYSGLSINDNDIRVFVECIYRMHFVREFITSSLIEHFKGLKESILKECAGVVALKLNTNPRVMLIWTKVEQVQTINWGGNPNESDTKMTLSPRKSFEKFAQVVTYKALRWDITTEHKLKIVSQKIEDVFELSSTNTILNHQKHIISSLEEEKSKNQSQLIEMLISMIEQRDAYTAGHTQRVAKYCEILANELSLDSEKIELLTQAAKLHDIGKISIPDSLLLKPARLNQNEYILIKQHLNVGYEILSKIDYYKDIAEIMRYHHEKYDGSGYPEAKKGDEISIEANIMVVADALDAMTSNRIYQKRKSVEEAIQEIKIYSGIWYHPRVVNALLNVYNKGKITTVDTNQLPLTKMEEERFSYFFKDQLTGFYNDSYLWMVVNRQIPSIKPEYFLLIELKDMSFYNKIHSWHNGNILIKNIANYISQFSNQKLIFRIFGDDFVIGFDDKDSFESMINRWNEIKIGNVYTSLKEVDKEYLIDKMESFL